MTSTTTHLVIPDPHSNPAHHKECMEVADLVGNLILDFKPSAVINLGDTWDFPSLSGYDKGKASFHGKNYKKDLESGLEFDDRLWRPIRKAKRKKPFTVFIEGNHEYRVNRTLEYSPELEGAISKKDLQLEKNYDVVSWYTGGTPSSICVDGITYSHFALTGVSGRPISGEHPAYSLLTKQFESVTVGHLHTLDHCIRTTMGGRKVHGLVAGCLQPYDPDWAGKELCKMWSRGVVLKHFVDNGTYDLEWVSLDRLRQEYGASG